MSPPPETKVYTPDSAAQTPGLLLGDLWRDLLAGRELAWRLAVRDISAQYRQAALGVAWALILPLANTLTWVFLQGAGVISVGETGLPYPLYVFTGTMLWAIFMEATNAPLQQTLAAKGMLSKVNFPREALVLAGVLQTAFNAAIKVALLIVVLLAYGIYPGWGIMLFPLGLVSLIMAGTALGLVLTPVGVLYSDIGKGLPLVLQFLMFLTPIVFPLPEGGWAALVVGWNPLTPLIVTTRDWLTGTAPELVGAYVLVCAAMMLMLAIVAVAYRLAIPILIERMGS